MARVISVFLPLWPIDRLRRWAGEAAPASDEARLVLAGRVGNRRLVTAACALAQELSLSVDMPMSKVQVLVPISLGERLPAKRRERTSSVVIATGRHRKPILIKHFALSR